jgi:TolB protein
VFDSNRDRAEGDPLNTGDLFLMNADGSEQTRLTRGSSASWSPDCKNIAFHASASGTGTPIKPDPGAATTDSDIFVANVDDLVAGTGVPRDITNSEGMIDDDPDWSPDGRSIVYTAHPKTDNPVQSNQAEIYVINADGTGTPHRLTNNTEEERGADWSPDGKRIEYMCRIGGGSADFELCVMNADGTDQHALTDNMVQDLSTNWSPDGQQIVFHRPVAGPGTFQLFVIKADGTEDPATAGHPLIFPFPPGVNGFADWGLLRVKDQG